MIKTKPAVYTKKPGATEPAKASIHLRVDSDVLAWFRAQGAGYQTRMQAALRDYMNRHQ